jgi:hypothetical protein
MRDSMAVASDAVMKALIGGPVEVTIQRPSKSRDQERLYHALIADIARTEVDGRKYDDETWKALLIDEFSEEMKRQGTPLSHPGRVIPSLDGMRTVTIRASSRRFRVAEASAFVAFLYAYGSDLGVIWSDPAIKYYEDVLDGTSKTHSCN